MGELLMEVRRHAGRYGLLTPGETIVVGVSGGPDSLCLLHLLCRLAPEIGLRLHVAHLNHGLRGAQADEDARFVAELSQAWGLPCTMGEAAVDALARSAGLSIEEAARQVRYGFLAEVASGSGAQAIAVGHNADDQAETVLMHFLRGSGAAGLRGMLPRTPIADFRYPGSPCGGQWPQPGGQASGGGGQFSPPLTRPDLWLIRPLLCSPRSEIERYCAEHDLQPRFDRSNEDRTFYRNRLRHELLPILEEYNPAIRRVLARTAEVMAGDYAILRTQLDRVWEQVAEGSAPESPLAAEDEVRLNLSAWRALPPGLQRATIREAVHRLRRHLRNINWEHVERAVWLAREGTTGQMATLAAGLALEIGYDTLRIGPEHALRPQLDVPQIDGPVPLSTSGCTAIGNGWHVTVEFLSRPELPVDYDANEDPWVAWLDAEAVGADLRLWPRQPGDRFQPQGLDGHSSRVNEFMINARVPRQARDRWPLLLGRDGIAWLCGLRVDERAIVRPETARVWRVAFGRE